MEININQGSLPVCSAVCRTKNSFTAECDVIIPDVKPDILKALRLSAVSRINSCETKNGRVSVTGTLHFTILYLADDEEKTVRSIHSSCEFSNVVRDDAIAEGMLTFIDVDVSDIICNIANCRKLTLRATLDMSLQVYSCHDISVISGVDGACTQTTELNSSVICAHAQSSSTLTDSFKLSDGKAPLREIFMTDGTITDSEIKVIDDKAIVKGNVLITVLYRSDAGIEHARYEAPFAHIVEADGIREDMNIEYSVKIISVEAFSEDVSAGMPCSISFSADMSFRVVARCTHSTRCVTDAFVPKRNIECESFTLSVDSIETTINHKTDVKDKITLPDGYPSVSEVYQVIAKPHIESCTTDGDLLRASGHLETYVLYLSGDKNSPVCSYKTNIDFTASMESPGCSIVPMCDCCLKNLSYTITSDNSLEIRSSVDVRIQCIRTTEESIVYNILEKEYTPLKRPSIIVSCVCSECSLWDIAKEYGVHPDSILKANALESEHDIKPHMTLIIPK